MDERKEIEKKLKNYRVDREESDSESEEADAAEVPFFLTCFPPFSEGIGVGNSSNEFF